MYWRFYNPNSNPVMQVLSLLVFGVFVVGAVLMGAVILSVVLAVGAVAAAIIAVRVWWLRRKLQQAARHHESVSSINDGGNQDHVVDAEYTVVSEDSTRRRNSRQ